jgi:hypothetical protein
MASVEEQSFSPIVYTNPRWGGRCAITYSRERIGENPPRPHRMSAALISPENSIGIISNTRHWVFKLEDASNKGSVCQFILCGKGENAKKCSLQGLTTRRRERNPTQQAIIELRKGSRLKTTAGSSRLDNNCIRSMRSKIFKKYPFDIFCVRAVFPRVPSFNFLKILGSWHHPNRICSLK